MPLDLLAQRQPGPNPMYGAQFAFNAGELSPEMEGRTDLAKYANACRSLKNFIPRVTGPARKRPGLRFVKECIDSSQVSRLIPFEFSNVQAYTLEFSELKMRVYRDGGVVLEATKTITGLSNANPGEVTCTSHGYSTGDQVYITGVGGMTQVNGRYFTVTSTGANTFTIGVDTSAYGTYTSGGTAARVYTLATPWADTDLAAIQWVQSADTLYLVHPNYAPRKITRTAHTSWTVTEISFDWPAFNSENATATTLDASAKSGAITITASAATFVAGDVGRLIKFREVPAEVQVTWGPLRNLQRNDTVLSVGDYCQYNGNVYELQDKHGASTNCGESPPIHTEAGTEENDGKWDWTYIHSGEGYAVITGYTSSTQVSATVVKQLPNDNSSATNPPATKLWAWGAWDATSGYPRSVTFHEDRLWFGGTSAAPQSLWASVIGDYENFQALPDDSSALQYTISDDEVNVLEWLRGGKVLFIGTAGGVFPGAGADPDKAITISNPLRAPKHISEGCEDAVGPLVIGNAIVFVQRLGRRVRETAYDFGSDSYATNDLTLLADHLFLKSPIVAIAYQNEPDRVLWAITADGHLFGLSYDRQQEVIGWHRHPIGGAFSGGDAVVESISVIPHPDADQDQLWLVVKRTINGSTKRYVEVMEKPWRSDIDAVSDAFYVDSGITYSGSSATAIAGLDHLEGQSVYVASNAAQQGPYTVTSGAITIGSAVTLAQIGLLYTAELAPERPELPLGNGTIQTKRKRVTTVAFRLFETGDGVAIGPDTSTLESLPWRAYQDPSGTALTIFTGDTQPRPFRGGYEQGGFIVFQHQKALPCTVLSMVPGLIEEEV